MSLIRDENTYDNYMILLKLLVDLFKQDKGDSKEADQLRDEMDPIWKSMTKEERRKADSYANGELKNI